MAYRMSQEHLMAQVIVVGDEDASPVEEAVVQTPQWQQLTVLQVLEELLGVRGYCCSAADVINEGKCWP
jgi:hypothetical protein